MKKLTRWLRNELENDILKKAKPNPKPVWQYIKSKSKTKGGIKELYIDQCSKKGRTGKDSHKVYILEDFSCSVFVKKPIGDVLLIQDRTIKCNMKKPIY